LFVLQLSEARAAAEALSAQAAAAERAATAALARADAETSARIAANAEFLAAGGSGSGGSSGNSAPGDGLLGDLVASLKSQLDLTRGALAAAQANARASEARGGDADARAAAAASQASAAERAATEAKAAAADLTFELAATRAAAEEASDARDAMEAAMRQTARFRQLELEESMHELIDACERGDAELASMRAANETLQIALVEADARAAAKAVFAAPEAHVEAAAGAQDASAAAQPQQQEEQPPPPSGPSPTLARAQKAEADGVALRAQLEEAYAALARAQEAAFSPLAPRAATPPGGCGSCGSDGRRSVGLATGGAGSEAAAAWLEERADLVAQVAELRVQQQRASQQHEAWVGVLQEAHEESTAQLASDHALRLEAAVSQAHQHAYAQACAQAQAVADAAAAAAEARCAAEAHALRDALSDAQAAAALGRSTSAAASTAEGAVRNGGSNGSSGSSSSSSSSSGDAKKPPLLILTLKCAVLEFLRSEDPRPGKGVAVAGLSANPKTLLAIREQALKVCTRRLKEKQNTHAHTHTQGGERRRSFLYLS
jgi:hypothetical protein